MLVKNFIPLVSFIAFLAISNSCSEDIDLTTDTKSIPVVYCIINPQDSIYRVLLSKTFNGNKSTFEMAQDPEMIYYKNARVSLEAWSKGYRIWDTQFKPAANTRDSGFFSSTPGFAFETKEVISKHFGYAASQNIGELFDYLRLVVEYQDDAEPAFARISTSLSKPRIEYPVYSYKVFNLCDSIPYYLVFNTSDILYYDLRCKFRYTEDSETGEYKTVDFSVQPNIQTNIGKKQLFIYPSVFFRRLALAFPNTDKITSRKFVSLDLELQVGSTSMRTYMNTYYTDNDKGYELWNCFHNGIGLFALKNYTAMTNLIMDQKTKDSLADGQYTRQLLFSKW